MEKTPNKYAFLIRTICYILIPISILAIIQSVIYFWFFEGEQEVQKNKTFFETAKFLSLYENSIYENVSACYQPKSYAHSLEEYETQGKIDSRYEISISNLYEVTESKTENGTIYYKTYLNEKNFKFLIIDNKTKTAFTNVSQTMKTDTVEKIKQELSAYTYYWNYEQGEVNTNIQKLSLENMKYDYPLQALEGRYDCTIYTAIQEPLTYRDYYYNYYFLYELAPESANNAIFNFPFAILIILICITCITIYTGRKKGKQEIQLDILDKIPLEIVLCAILAIAVFVLIVFKATFKMFFNVNYFNSISISIGITVCGILYIIGILSYETLVKRIKTHTFWKNTLLYRFYKIVKLALRNVFSHLSISLIIGIIILGLTVLPIFFISLGFVGILLFIAMWGISFYVSFSYYKKLIEVKEMAKNIYEGNTQIRLNEEEYKGDLKELSIYLNDIAGGFQNAINKSLKSERMKTELITNVSHDIKTPLTSIINYVDLLKKEKMPNKKATEYLEILDQKSQRLKHLTEDLVEASKASSGNIKLNMEKLDVKELIKQVSGEYEDRLKEKKLELILDLPENEAIITADSRYLYRVMENMYSNIVKYALPKSRVYVDVSLQEGIVEINLKNISKEKLNITAEELMERFVRGESSRNTEGSGLGLSIAQSLTELQQGTFQIYLDGDLFKVTIQFKQ